MCKSFRLFSIAIHMCRHNSPLRLLLIAICLSYACATEHDISTVASIPLSCIAQWDISSATLHNVAYMWTHEHKVTNWIFEPISNVGDTQLENSTCAFMEYDTVVKVPKSFVDFIPARVTETHVYKQVCANSNKLIERVRFSKLLLIKSFSINLQSTIDNEHKRADFSATSDMPLPWFTKPLKQIIFGHVKKSILEYMHLLADSLCATAFEQHSTSKSSI